MPSAIQLAKDALIRLGEVPIDSFEEETEAARTLNVVFPSLRDGLLSLYPWRFATRKRQLAQIAEEPLNEWKLAYQLPTDRLAGPYAVFNSGEVGASPMQRYEIFQDRLFTDAATIWIDYQFKVDPERWPPYFVEFFVLALAAEIAVPVTGSTSLSTLYNTRAWGQPNENRMGGAYRQARSRDAMQQPPQQITDFPLIRARFS